MDNITEIFAQVAQGKTRDELEAFARRLQLGAKRARADADASAAPDEKADLLEQSDSMNFAADELFAHAQSAAPAKTIKWNGVAHKTAIYLGQDPGAARPFIIAVMSRIGSHHVHDFQTRDEALIYIESLRPNWPDLPVFEIERFPLPPTDTADPTEAPLAGASDS